MVVDRMGNMFARRRGEDDALPPVMMGSHLDTQPTGGKYDGVLGVLGALEVMRTLKDLNVKTRHPIEIANWTNEEGSRFAPAMVASGEPSLTNSTSKSGVMRSSTGSSRRHRGAIASSSP